MNYTIAEPFRAQFIAFILLLATSLGCYGDERGKDKVLFIELFTTTQPLTHINSNLPPDNSTGVKYTHYEIDHISQLQRELSRGLPKDTEQAKQLVLQRFQLIDATVSQRLENTAKGLVKALHYGIDRTPAMVFDGQAVIYGVTDVDEATQRYSQWRERNDR